MSMPKASVNCGPVLAFRIYNKYYTSDVQAAKALSDHLARRVGYVIDRAGSKPMNVTPFTWMDREKRAKRLKKRAYPRCKFYVQRWLKPK